MVEGDLTMAAIEADETGDTPLDAAGWLVGDLGIAMPPIPHIYVDAIDEVVGGLVFGTAAALADLDTPRSLAVCLETTGWPEAGIAFGYQPVGSGGRWFYVLVSEKICLQISLRSRPLGGDTEVWRNTVSLAHGQLERYLSDEINYGRAIQTNPSDLAGMRTIIAYSNEAGYAQELHAAWSTPGTPLTLSPRNEVFLPAQPEAREEDLIILR